ncbi:hypothetical protein [Phormidium sp. CCY1219]|uniref:hypothetical protein n=1 Tax=Phormidium sp. CCY1219 TaxID=2886104 RepID=UPI002D1E980B|nr:hypothetical protein [Phormidium sp. CCY1219]MEB3831806.1 hypothetical protein [Phormidium sp. CCY1219]
MAKVVFGFFKSDKAYYSALWNQIKHWKDSKQALSLSVEQKNQKVWHRGHIVLEEKIFIPIVRFKTKDNRIMSRRCSLNGLPIYAIEKVSQEVYEVRPLSGSNNSKENQVYFTSEQDCTCPAWRKNTGLIGGRCKHQLMLQTEFQQIKAAKKLLEKQIIPAHPQKIQKAEPASVKLVQLCNGYSPFPGCQLRAESGDSGYDFKVLGEVEDRANKQRITACFGLIHPQPNNRFTYSNRRIYSQGNPLQTEENIARACRELKNNSDYKNCSFWEEKPKNEENEEVDMNNLFSASINLQKAKIPQKTYTYRVIRNNNDLWSFYNTDTNSFADQAVYYEEINERTRRLHNQGHKIEILSPKGHFRWNGEVWRSVGRN